MLISHLQEAVLAHFVLLSFFLIKNNKNRFKFVIYGLISWILASFWYIPFLKYLSSTTLIQDYEGLHYWWSNIMQQQLLTNILAIILPLVFILMFYLYYKQNKNKRELLFYLPILILSILFLTRLSAIIPIIKNISIDPMILFLLIFTIILFLKIDFEKYKIKELVKLSLLIIVIISISISLFVTPYFTEYKEVDRDSLELINDVDGKLFVLPYNNIVSANSYNSYIPIRYNISVVSGWYPYLSTSNHIEKVSKLRQNLESGECSILIKELGISNILTYGDYCEELSKCHYNKISQKGDACLFYAN